MRVDVRVHDGDVQRLADLASAGSLAALDDIERKHGREVRRLLETALANDAKEPTSH
jgi:hypothetical protein